jgi:hypothetical protein
MFRVFVSLGARGRLTSVLTLDSCLFMFGRVVWLHLHVRP